MVDYMTQFDVTIISNTILIIIWILLPKLWRICKKKDIFNIFDIPFDLLPIFVLSYSWKRFVLWIVIYTVIMVGLRKISIKNTDSFHDTKSDS